MSVNPVSPVTFNGGQMTDLPEFSGTFDGTELIEIVAPGNEVDGVNYSINTGLLGELLSGLSVDVYLVVGDSNAVGQGTSASAPVVQPGQALMYCADGVIRDANDPTQSAVSASRNANTGSMWPAFGISYGRKVGLVLTGKSGSTQVAAADTGSGNWDTSGALYAESLTALNSALNAFTAAGYAPNFRGIIYILGNNDAAKINDATITAANYTSALTAMLVNYRAASIGGITYPKLPVYVPIIGTNITTGSDAGYRAIRGAQQAYAATDGNTLVPFVDMLSFAARGLINSGVHPTQAGYNLMGTLIGSRMVPYVPAIVPYQLINANTAIGVVPPSNTIFQLVGADATVSRLTFDGYGAHPQIQMRHASGTTLAPTATLNGNTIGNYTVQGYGATGFSAAVNGALLFSATQDHTDSAHGTKAAIYVTANGSSSPVIAGTFNQDRTVQLPAYGAGTLVSDASGNIAVANPKVVNTTYDLTTASGNQVVSGFGFTPSSCEGFGAVNAATLGSYATLSGHCDKAFVQAALGFLGGAAYLNPAGQCFFIAGDVSGANYQLGVVTAFGSGTITIAWTKVGSPTGTFSMSIRALP